ncbi:MAG: alpha/beta fold hydrolase [Holophagae bacterium]|jgi:dipeptidyl aminopeptidase/acylaminoacyl peptidase
MNRYSAAVGVVVALALTVPGWAEESESATLEAVQQARESAGHQFDVVAKLVDDVLWYHRVGDVAVVDKFRIYGPPRWKEDNPTGKNAGNHVKFYTYLFTPKGFNNAGKLPLLVLPHGGVHADFTTYYAHIVRELVSQGYIVVAPEYRGSTGYGRGFYEDIDYGGLEVADALAARDWVVENHPRVDPKRVGVLGWSHGGLITLFSLFRYPDSYACGFAGVPVSDLVQRMGYMTQSYRDLYEADYFIGQSAAENLEEYKRRSPVWSVDKLTKPLRIHTNLNDEDVNYIEVEHLIQALTAAGKDFEHEVSDVPGGHSFDRLDTPEAWGYRKKIYAFLARYLKPPKPQIELGLTAAGHAGP